MKPMQPIELASHGPVIPVIVLERLQDAVPLARALVEGGVRVLEVTLRTPVALECIAAIAAPLAGSGTGNCPTTDNRPGSCRRWRILAPARRASPSTRAPA